jgi:hypothetical protein
MVSLSIARRKDDQRDPSGSDMATVPRCSRSTARKRVTTLATCWKIARRDAVALGFTDHVRHLAGDGITHRGGERLRAHEPTPVIGRD